MVFCSPGHESIQSRVFHYAGNANKLDKQISETSQPGANDVVRAQASRQLPYV